MSTKTKKTKTPTETLVDLTQQAGLLLMTAAVTIGMVELPEHANNKIIVPNQPSFAFANNNSGEANPNNPLRREREEAGPHYISYNIAQRTPGRTGKR
jgi:hypothetical protein